MLHLLVPDVSIAGKILRSVVVYVFILLAFRLAGKRQVGQLTPFDLVVLLILSNVVQNAVIGNDNSLGGGLIGAVTILVLNYAFVEVTYRNGSATTISSSRSAGAVSSMRRRSGSRCWRRRAASASSRGVTPGARDPRAAAMRAFSRASHHPLT